MTSGWGLLVASLAISLDSLGIGFSILFVGVPVGLSLVVIGIVSVIATLLGLAPGSLAGIAMSKTRSEMLARRAACAHRRHIYRAQGFARRLGKAAAMRVHAGESILELWSQSGLRSLFVVGTGKNVGKTVALRAIYRACADSGIVAALPRVGRDGEAFDIADARSQTPPLARATDHHRARRATCSRRSPASEIAGTHAAPHRCGRARVRTRSQRQRTTNWSDRQMHRQLRAVVARFTADGAARTRRRRDRSHRGACRRR